MSICVLVPCELLRDYGNALCARFAFVYLQCSSQQGALSCPALACPAGIKLGSPAQPAHPKRPGALAAEAAPPAKRRRAAAPPTGVPRPAGRPGARPPGSRGGSPAAAAARSMAAAAQLPLTFSQLDPSVLAELPPELQREVLNALPGASARGHGRTGRAAAQHPLGAAQGRAVHSHGQEGSQGQPRIYRGLGKVLGPHAAPATQLPGICVPAAGQPGRRTMPAVVAFADEPWQEVSRAVEEAVHALSAAAAAAPAAPLASQQGKASGSATAVGAAAAAKLGVLAELLVQWLVGRDHDLELLGSCLRQLQKLACSQPAFAAHAAAAETALQAHVRSRYGFTLRSRGLLAGI